MSRVAAHVAAVAVLVARHLELAAVVVRGMSASRCMHRRGAKCIYKACRTSLRIVPVSSSNHFF
jgi:hypothetical protein